jgi:hypothetical protein
MMSSTTRLLSRHGHHVRLTARLCQKQKNQRFLHVHNQVATTSAWSLSCLLPDNCHHTVSRSFSSRNNNNNNNNESLIPGSSSQSPYGSLGEPSRSDPSSSIDDFYDSSNAGSAAKAWQAQTHLDIQQVTRNALIYQLQQQQTQTISRVVPWFLENMPASYFQQIPPTFRMDHIAAIAAVKDVANMDLYLNLKSQVHDGRTIYTFIRPSTSPGTLLSMGELLL